MTSRPQYGDGHAGEAAERARPGARAVPAVRKRLGLVSAIACLYFLTVGWTGVVLTNEWIRPYVALGVLIVLALVLHALLGRRVPRSLFPKRDAFIIAYLFLVTVHGILDPNPKTGNYIAAYWFVFVTCYFCTKILPLAAGGISRCLSWNAAGVLGMSCLVIVEMVLKTGFGIAFSDILPMINRQDALASLGGVRMPRAYGLAPEPGVLGMYLDTLGVVGLYWTWKVGSRRWFATYAAIVGQAYFFAHSAGALAALGVGLVFAFLGLNRRQRTVWVRTAGLVALVTIPAFTILGARSSGFSIIEKLMDPAAGSEHRVSRWKEGIVMLEATGSVTGTGLGYITSSVSQSSFINWYLMVLVESGLLGLTLVAGFLAATFASVWRLEASARPWFAVAVVAGSAQLVTVSTFFDPFLWVSMALQCAVAGDSAAVRRVHTVQR